MSTAFWQFLLTCLLACRRFNLASTNNKHLEDSARTDVTCSGVLLQLCSRPLILLISSTIWCRVWLISAPLLSESNQRKKRRENCSTAAFQAGCEHLRSKECARYATKHVDLRIREADSYYVMKKPSRCWLGAVPKYGKVVASCFQFVSFAENTSAPLATTARIVQPILLLFFLFSCSWIWLLIVYHSKFSGVQKKTEFA